jgi:hypothetical protein
VELVKSNLEMSKRTVVGWRKDVLAVVIAFGVVFNFVSFRISILVIINTFRKHLGAAVLPDFLVSCRWYLE